MDFYDILFAKSLGGEGGGGESNGLTYGEKLTSARGASVFYSIYNASYLDVSGGNLAQRMSLWSAVGDAKPTIFHSASDRSGTVPFYIIPIPQGSSKAKLTIDATIMVAFTEVDIQGSTASSTTGGSSWLNTTSGSPLEYSLNSSSKGLMISCRVDSSNTSFNAENSFYYAKLEFE